MAFDEGLAMRIREQLSEQPGLSERRMFGGLAFMVNGNMCAGVLGDELMARVGPAQYQSALVQPYAREMDFTGRAMTGLVMVSQDALAEDDELDAWLQRSLDFCLSLPPK